MTNEQITTDGIEKLVKGLDPNAEVPKGFGLWDKKLIIAWLNQNQKKTKS